MLRFNLNKISSEVSTAPVKNQSHGELRGKDQIIASSVHSEQVSLVSPPVPIETNVSTTKALVYKTIDELSDLRYESLDKYHLSNSVDRLLLMSGENGYVVFFEKNTNHAFRLGILEKLKNAGLVIEQRYAERELIDATHKTHLSQILNGPSSQSDIERFINDLLEDALIKGASDIHIEVREQHTDIYFRIYGIRYMTKTISKNMGLAIAGVMFDTMADAASKTGDWSKDIPKDAAINYIRPSNGKRVQVRFASAPIYPSGCSQIVCRLLPMDPASAPAFELLGYSRLQQKSIEEMIVGAQGLVLLVGPTNSGKSTTMQALTKMARESRGKTIKIESIEDPVEYLIDGASQMPVSSRIDFAGLLKATLRHDPDVLMVGEIRDKESATTIESMVLAGRKVFATLHAFEALAVPQRLIKIGINEDVLYMNNFLSGVIYQRLLPVLCDHCAIPWEDAIKRKLVDAALCERVHEKIVDTSRIHIHNPDGCDHCRGRAPGYKGRTVTAEILRPDEVMLDTFRSGNIHHVREQWLKQPSDSGFGVTALGYAMSLMVKGVVDPKDVETQVGILTSCRT